MENKKSLFPIFNRHIHKKPLVFLDSAASAQKPQIVIDAMSEVMSRHYANINRGVYLLSEEITQMVEDSRVKVARFIGASEEEIVFTRNATESINLVAYSWGRHTLHKGDVVVISEMEHHANVVPWQILQKELGIEIVWIPVTEDGYLAVDQLASLAGQYGRRIKLVSITHVSNVLGTINPLKEILNWARDIGARTLIDGAQGVTNLSVNVKDLDCDWYVFSGHKLYGPSGVGVLYGKKEILDEMPPFLGGGDMIVEVKKETSTFKDAPYKFEAGTPAIVEIIGLGAAIDFVSEMGMDSVRDHTLELLTNAYGKLQVVPGLKLYGPSRMEDKGGVLAFTIEGIHPHDIATLLDEDGIAIRSGHHCAQVLCDRFGAPAMARISFGLYNDINDIDILLDSLLRVVETFK